jgi:hypothetical protein
MPQLVIEDMAILLPQDVDLAASAAALDAFFNANPAWSDISIRGFEVRQMPSQTPLLKADSARIDASQGKKSFAKNSLLSRQSAAMSLLCCRSASPWKLGWPSLPHPEPL